MLKEKLSAKVGFEVPIHRSFTKKFGREIVDMSRFIDLYRIKYGRVTIYQDMRTRFGDEVISLLKELT